MQPMAMAMAMAMSMTWQWQWQWQWQMAMAMETHCFVDVNHTGVRTQNGALARMGLGQCLQGLLAFQDSFIVSHANVEQILVAALH